MELKEEHILLITKHFRGESSVGEEKKITQWIAESEHNKKVYNEMEYIWNIAQNTSIEIPDMDKAWKNIKEKAQIDNKDKAEEEKIIPFYNFNTILKIAASIVLIIAAGYFTINLFQKEELTIISSTNKKKEITLPDGSKVWINKNSTLSYSSNYNDEDREVNLEGEAFFEVTKNPNKPFIVNGLLSQTKVLGTSFNVRSLKKENSDKIQVLTGKVSFKSNKKNEKNVVLLPGDMAIADNIGTLNTAKSNTQNAIAWKNNKLLFNNSTLKEVIESSNNYFDTKIMINNPDLLNCRFTGSFTNPDMEEIVKVISISMNLSYKKSDSSYYLNGEGCK